ncbi:hypothetical protein HYU93_03365 [Candidatus Daviesbacteria bacterium]|nr:hypothetical protein [Candidatus Daviesbacteria bacterium]
MLKANDSNIRKAEKRLEILEEGTGINIPLWHNQMSYVCSKKIRPFKTGF